MHIKARKAILSLLFVTQNQTLTEWSQEPVYMLSSSGHETPATHWEWPCSVARGSSCKGPSAAAELTSAALPSFLFLLTALLVVGAASCAAAATSRPASINQPVTFTFFEGQQGTNRGPADCQYQCKVSAICTHKRTRTKQSASYQL